MGEVYAWPEATVYLWTGSASVSAVAAYGRGIRADVDHGVDNHRTLDGVYHNLHTGKRIDVQITTLFVPDLSALETMAEAETAVHMHLLFYNSAHVGSAGRILYTGAIDRHSLNGSEGGFFQATFSYHANVWTSYNK